MYQSGSLLKKRKSMVKCKSEKTDYKCKIDNSIIDFYADTTEEKGGKNDGIQPNELLEAALASCINITIRMVLKKLNLHSESVSVTVTLDRSIDGVSSFHTEYDPGIKLNDEQEEILQSAIDNCSVKRTLKNDLVFNSEKVDSK